MTGHVTSTVTDPATGLTRATCTCGRLFPAHRSVAVAASRAAIHTACNREETS